MPLEEPEMILVAGGTFTMGCNDDDGCDSNSIPVHQVTLSSFKIAKYEVTQKLWKEIMGNNPSSDIGDNLPVQHVSWDDVQLFIKKLNGSTGKQYRLPTEAEWEYAARGGNQSENYKYSGSNNKDEVAWYESNSNGKIQPVGTKKPNELGIYDMSGNVQEWCQDGKREYTDEPQTNPRGPESDGRTIRGGDITYPEVGSYYKPDRCCVYIRYSWNHAQHSVAPYNYYGFRLVLSQ